MFRNGGTTDPVEYVMLLIFWPIFWSICMCRYGANIIYDIIPNIINLCLIIAIVAYVQYFISPSLWGFITYESNAIKWAEGKAFNEYSIFFRASSLVGSPQVLGIIMPFALVLVTMQKPIKFIIRAFWILILIGGAITSGGKVTLLLMMIFILIKIYSHLLQPRITKVTLSLMSIMLLLLSFLVLRIDTILEILPAFDRIIDLRAAIDQENRDSRLDRLMFSFSEANPILGNGYTHTLFREISGYLAAESYIAKLYFSFGILPSILLLTIFWLSFKRVSGANAPMVRNLIIMILTTLFVSTAFESTAFFPFWGLVIAGLLGNPNYYIGHDANTH